MSRLLKGEVFVSFMPCNFQIHYMFIKEHIAAFLPEA